MISIFYCLGKLISYVLKLFVMMIALIIGSAFGVAGFMVLAIVAGYFASIYSPKMTR